MPSIYDESSARIHRSNATTTNDYHPTTLTSIRDKSNELNSCEPTVSNSKFEQKTSIRRCQSNVHIHETPQSNMKKSKSLIDMHMQFKETNSRHQTELYATIDTPIPGCHSILRMLEHVFEDNDESTEQNHNQPDSLEPLLPTKRSFSNEHRYESKLIEEAEEEEENDQQDEPMIPRLFRRTHSNQGGRRRRRPSRRATCKRNNYHNSTDYCLFLFSCRSTTIVF